MLDFMKSKSGVQGKKKKQKDSGDFYSEEEVLDQDEKATVNIAFRSAILNSGIVSISAKAIKDSKTPTEANSDVSDMK